MYKENGDYEADYDIVKVICIRKHRKDTGVAWKHFNQGELYIMYYDSYTGDWLYSEDNDVCCDWSEMYNNFYKYFRRLNEKELRRQKLLQLKLQ